MPTNGSILKSHIFIAKSKIPIRHVLWSAFACFTTSSNLRGTPTWTVRNGPAWNSREYFACQHHQSETKGPAGRRGGSNKSHDLQCSCMSPASSARDHTLGKPVLLLCEHMVGYVYSLSRKLLVFLWINIPDEIDYPSRDCSYYIMPLLSALKVEFPHT